MVRAGVVTHTSEWEFCGYNEIQKTKQRYSLIDQQRLYSLAESGDSEKFRVVHLSWIDEAMRKRVKKRKNHWTESIAVGNKEFVEKVKEKLGFKARGRRVESSEAGTELRERVSAYKADFDVENICLSQNSSHFWNNNHEFTNS